jgi:hypothetical protein
VLEQVFKKFVCHSKLFQRISSLNVCLFQQEYLSGATINSYPFNHSLLSREYHNFLRYSLACSITLGISIPEIPITAVALFFLAQRQL